MHWSFPPRLVTPQAMLPYACGVTRREGATPMQAKWIKLDIVIMHRYTFWDSCHGGVRKERRKPYAMYVMYGRFGLPVLIGGVQSSVHFDFIHWNIVLFNFNISTKDQTQIYQKKMVTISKNPYSIIELMLLLENVVIDVHMIFREKREIT